MEAGIDSYTSGRVPQGQDYADMHSKSPVAYLDNIVTPSMIMLGKDDRRVPPSQGIEFHKALLAKGVESRLALLTSYLLFRNLLLYQYFEHIG